MITLKSFFHKGKRYKLLEFHLVIISLDTMCNGRGVSGGHKKLHLFGGPESRKY